jgi:hypothetical protein
MQSMQNLRNGRNYFEVVKPWARRLVYLYHSYRSVVLRWRWGSPVQKSSTRKCLFENIFFLSNEFLVFTLYRRFITLILLHSIAISYRINKIENLLKNICGILASYGIYGRQNLTLPGELFLTLITVYQRSPTGGAQPYLNREPFFYGPLPMK